MTPEPLARAAQTALVILHRQGVVALLTDLTGCILWCSPAAHRLVHSRPESDVAQFGLRAISTLRATIDDVARVSGNRGTVTCAFGTEAATLHVENRMDDPAVNGLVWWSENAMERAEAAQMEAAIEQIAAALEPVLKSPAVPSSIPTLPGVEHLSPRENEVLRMVGDGLRAPSIARRMYVSASTVRNYLSSTYRKLGVSSQVELLELLAAARNGERV